LQKGDKGRRENIDSKTIGTHKLMGAGLVGGEEIGGKLDSFSKYRPGTLGKQRRKSEGGEGGGSGKPY